MHSSRCAAIRREHCATVRKAMVQINELYSVMSPQSFNQITRWVATKEEHCGKLIDLLANCNLCQRTNADKLSEGAYAGAQVAHHMAATAAMKAKQSVDVAACDALELAVGVVCQIYCPGPAAL